MDYNELEQMTVVALRDEAKNLGSKSTTGMKKEELIEFIAGEMGLEKPAPKPKKKKAGGPALTKEQIKAKITELRAAREAAQKTNDPKKVDELRRRIHSLKRRQRKAA